MKIRRAQIALAAFVMFLILLVVLADTGRGSWLFAAAGHLPGGDKLGHFILFGTLSLLVNLLTQARKMQLLGLTVLKGNVVLMSLVTLEECSQLFFRSRSFDLLDLASDAAGIWVFGNLAAAYGERKRRSIQTVPIPPCEQ